MWRCGGTPTRMSPGLYRLATVDVSTRDGSVNVKFPRKGDSPATVAWREGGDAKPRSVAAGARRLRKITIHASGRVNDDRRNEPIFLEPLTRVSVPWVVAYYRFPSIGRLDRYEKTIDDRDLVWDGFADRGAGPGCVALLVAPPRFEPEAPAVGIGFYQRLALFFCICDVEAKVPDDLRDHFIHLAPGPGPLPEQAIKEDRALIDFHQAMTGSRDLVLYGPDKDGWYRAIFAVPMRIAPRVTVLPMDRALSTEVGDQSLDPRVNTAQVRFRFFDRRTGTVRKEFSAIDEIELDAEL
jgi:hypothetical protein